MGEIWGWLRVFRVSKVSALGTWRRCRGLRSQAVLLGFGGLGVLSPEPPNPGP